MAAKAVPLFLASLAVPGGAFLQVARGLYNGVMLFVEKGRQLAQVGQALFASASAIAAGQLTPAATAVENTLVKILPVALSFLARQLGLDGLSGAIQTGLQKVQVPVEKAVNRVLDTVAEKANALWAKLKRRPAKPELMAALPASIPADPQARLDAGLRAAARAVQQLPGQWQTQQALEPVLAQVKATYGFQQLEPYAWHGRWQVRGRVNPSGTLDLGRLTAAGEMQRLRVNDAIKVLYIDGMWVAYVTEITDKIVRFRYADARKKESTLPVEEFLRQYAAGKLTLHIDSRRAVFLGSNPSREGDVGKALKARYAAQGRYRVGPPEQFRHADVWYDLSACDLSHEPVDAVTYWNTVGYKLGPQAPEVRRWMNDPANYTFEPLALNRARGSRDNERYRDPEPQS